MEVGCGMRGELRLCVVYIGKEGWGWMHAFREKKDDDDGCVLCVSSLLCNFC